SYTILARLAGVERQSSGTLLHINYIDSVFGRGWGLQGLQELYKDPDPDPSNSDVSATVVDGSGEGQRFERIKLPPDLLQDCPDPDPNRMAQYKTVPGDSSKLETAPAAGFAPQ